MSYSNQNQLSLNLVCETAPNLKLKSPNPFLLSERVKRILYKNGYSHIFNYPEYNEFKSLSEGLTGNEKALFIAELFIENTAEQSDFADYIN